MFSGCAAVRKTAGLNCGLGGGVNAFLCNVSSIDKFGVSGVDRTSCVRACVRFTCDRLLASCLAPNLLAHDSCTAVCTLAACVIASLGFVICLLGCVEKTGTRLITHPISSTCVFVCVHVSGNLWGVWFAWWVRGDDQHPPRHHRGGVQVCLYQLVP